MAETEVVRAVKALSELRCFHRHEELLVVRGWKSLERWTGAHQRITIVRSVQHDGPWRLTRNEFDLTCAVALGMGVKQAAAELGVEWATARTRIRRALHKLGLRCCAQLPAFWHGMSGTPSMSRADDGTELLIFDSECLRHALAKELTSAQRDLLRAILLGMNTEQIARHRNTSVHTVAKQLRALFQRFGASSKGELASKVLFTFAGSGLPPPGSGT
jgi:DNA-binding NarL/FixJ family response regulator